MTFMFAAHKGIVYIIKYKSQRLLYFISFLPLFSNNNYHSFHDKLTLEVQQENYCIEKVLHKIIIVRIQDVTRNIS